MVVCLSLRCALVSPYMAHTYNVPQPFKILCDCNIALQLMFVNVHLFTPALGKGRYKLRKGCLLFAKSLKGRSVCSLRGESVACLL